MARLLGLKRRLRARERGTRAGLCAVERRDLLVDLLQSRSYLLDGEIILLQRQQAYQIWIHENLLGF
jgi:hypothetical protein